MALDWGRTWFRNFREHGVCQNSYLKQAKLGTLEYSGVNQAITVWIVKTKHNLIAKKKKKEWQYTCAFNPVYWPYFFDMNNNQNLSGKTENISVQCKQCSAILFWDRSRDCSVYITSEDGVLLRTPAQVFQCTWFLSCLFWVEGFKRTAKSSLPWVYFMHGIMIIVHCCIILHQDLQLHFKIFLTNQVENNNH